MKFLLKVYIWYLEGKIDPNKYDPVLSRKLDRIQKRVDRYVRTGWHNG